MLTKLNIILLNILTVVLGQSDSFKPVVLIHGIMADGGSMDVIKRTIEVEHTGSVVYNVDSFNDWASLEPLWHQVIAIGRQIAQFASQYPDGIHIVGYSQGGLIARGIIELFPNINVSTFVSLSAPQAGLYGVQFLQPIFPNLIAKTAYRLFYSRAGQHTSVGNYWNDPHHGNLYEKYSVFLPYLNNHLKSNKSEEFKRNFSKLKRVVLIGGPDDDLIRPWQSTQFGYFDANETVSEMRERAIYKEDVIGLKAVHEAGGLHVVTVEGVNHWHWNMNVTVIKKHILPYLD